MAGPAKTEMALSTYCVEKLSFARSPKNSSPYRTRTSHQAEGLLGRTYIARRSICATFAAIDDRNSRLNLHLAEIRSFRNFEFFNRIDPKRKWKGSKSGRLTWSPAAPERRPLGHFVRLPWNNFRHTFFGPGPSTASKRTLRRLANSSGVVQSMQLNCRISKCNSFISSILQVQKTGRPKPRA